MNGGRISRGKTPEERIAAVARTLVFETEMHYARTKTGPTEPDYADFREALAPYIQREILLARLDEASKACSEATRIRPATLGSLTERIQELAAELHEVERRIPSGCLAPPPQMPGDLPPEGGQE